MSRFITVFVFLLFVTGSLFAQNSPLWTRYPSISPDGQQIVFSYKGDLYTVSSQGGTAVPLTLHEAHDFMPVWSHDGKTIAYASYRYGNYDIYVMPAEGGESRRITHHSANDFPSDFSTDNASVLFSSSRTDHYKNAQFPYSLLGELYSISVDGGMPEQISSITAEDAKYSSDGSTIIFHDRKGYEDPWRKHHTSSIARDLWTYRPETGSYTRITQWPGEDREPVFNPSSNDEVFFLSEKNGSFNVHKLNLNAPSEYRAITSFSDHPVRSLSISDNGILAFSWDGKIYIKEPNSDPKQVNIKIVNSGRTNDYKTIPLSSQATEMALSPNGKEIAFIERGEIFVSSVDGNTVKKITDTPGQERSVGFSPDGRTLVYAAERNNNWDVYRSTITREEELYFFSSSVLEETPVVNTDLEEFQPAFSPDGKEIAYLEERVRLKVKNLESGESRMVYDGENNYSYSDGDQHYDWSPDGNWFLINYNQDNQWIGEVGLVNADGTSGVINLTKSGFSDSTPLWMHGGKMMIWMSDRDGQKNRGGWGGEQDVYGMFFTQKAYDLFQLSKEEYELYKKKQEKKEGEKEEDEDAPVELELDLENIKDRRARLTIHSTDLEDAVLSDDGETLYYLAEVKEGYDIWMTTPRTKETKILAADVGNNAGDLLLDSENNRLLVLADGQILSVDVASGNRSRINVRGEMTLYPAQERKYIFEHAWRQVKKKFYDTGLHGVDWEFYKEEYQKFLPHINNNHDFSEMLSEMLGELNASHTGSRYRPRDQYGDETAALGVFFRQDYEGPGLKIAEVVNNGPLDNADSKISAGTIIEKIDGTAIGPDTNIYSLLNRKAGENILLSLYEQESKSRWEEVVQPISLNEKRDLLYRRWVENNHKKVEELSDGKIGYVHVRSMNDESFRTVVDDVLGTNAQKEAVVVDTRFNGGGWIHEDLATFFSGEPYIFFAPREKRLGKEPHFKWTNPTAVLVNEGNYSDAHMFPYAYRARDLGKIIGMPVPGTGTAVWWERQIDPSLVFGIPQVGMLTPDGEYLENNQLEPDITLDNSPEELLNGVDQQLRRAVQLLLDTVRENSGSSPTTSGNQ